MNEETLEDFLLSLLDKRSIAGYNVIRTETFEDARIITENKGIVLTLDDGSVFHITIEQYSEGDTNE